jgi:LmbE family N-acetylglucosaminyl deacetylase
MVVRGAEVVYLSPHPDDVAFSAAAHVAHDVAQGLRVQVLTLFRPGGGGPFGDTETRQQEDERFAARLGVELHACDFPDAIVRHPRYQARTALFGPLPEDEEPLVESLRVRVQAAIDSCRPRCLRVLAPLAVGGHVDHEATRRAALRLDLRGAELVFYEDAPYVLKGDHPPPHALDLLQPSVLVDERAVKLDAIACYASQWPLFFPRLEDWRHALATYANELGFPEENVLAERVWRAPEK